MYCYLAVATQKGRVDRRCSDDSDVLMILPLRCLSPFNNTLIVLLVVIRTLCWYGPFHLAQLNVAAMWYNIYHLQHHNMVSTFQLQNSNSLLKLSLLHLKIFYSFHIKILLSLL